MEDKFEALTNDQRTEVMNFLQITGTEDVNAAIMYMEMTQFDVSNAVNIYFQNEDAGGQPLRSEQSLVQTSQSSASQRNENQVNNLMEGKVKEYRLFLARKAAAQEYGLGAMLKRLMGATFKVFSKVYNAIIPLAIRSEAPGGEEFIVRLFQQYPNIITFDFQKGIFNDNLDAAHEKKIPLLVFILNGGNSDIIRQILINKELRKYIGKSFHVLGLNGRSQEAQLLTSEVAEQNFPCFVVFRKSLLEKKEVIGIIPIADNHEVDIEEFYLEELKRLKQSFFVQLSEEDSVREAYVNRQESSRIRRDNFINENFYGVVPQQPPASQEEQSRKRLRIEQDRILRETQEVAFREAERQAMVKERTRKQSEDHIKQVESLKAAKDEERHRLVQAKRENIPEEPTKSNSEAFTFAFRVPDGSRITRRFLKTQKIQLLFDYIESREEIEFEGEDRKFDLIQTFPPLSLQNHLYKTVNEVFPDSVQEIVFVKEV